MQAVSVTGGDLAAAPAGATVNAKAVRAVLGVATALGLDAGALATAWGVTAALADGDARFPHAAWVGLWRDLGARTGRDGLGLAAAERLPWGHFDVIDYLIGASADLGAALRRFERYCALVSTGVTHRLEAHADAVHLVRRYTADGHTRLLAPAEFAFASVVGRTRSALGVRWCPRAVHFAAPPPASDAAHRQLFGCPVHFDATISVIVMDPAMLALPMPRPDPELARILERHAGQLVAALGDEDDVVGRVRRIIVDALPAADATVAGTARRLGMSVRTLQRRLQGLGQTFEEVYDRTRRELARRYLADPGLSIQEAAHLLAFGDLRGFYRAFRRWEGCTPAAYRRRARGGGAGAGASRP